MGNGRHIVLVSGDEEYRSEEGLTMLARMLSKHHGFRCTVLFAVDPETGIVNPHANTNTPGTENLDDADLMFLQTRWRTLPDEQMEPIDRYLKAGKASHRAANRDAWLQDAGRSAQEGVCVPSSGSSGRGPIIRRSS